MRKSRGARGGWFKNSNDSNNKIWCHKNVY